MSTQDAGTLVSASDLVTVSDYFSFVGADEQGHVAFAIDNNRGRDGSAYQAEHFYAVLHDEHHGWMKVSGIGRYENTNHELRPIPDSSFFQFVGQPATGLTITSPVNQLALRLASIPERLALSDDETIFSMGSAAAQLTWKERVIPGRVIYEYLVKKNFNLMTRRSLKGLGAFQGLYLLAGMASDLYIQHSLMKLTVAGTPPLLGFWVLGGQSEQLDQLRFEVPKHALAFGTYRWPTRWHIRWQGSKGLAEASVTLSTRKPLGNWLLAGFSMGIVSGKLSYDNQQIPLYGLAELFMM
jgi:hypothetical protein